MSDELTRGEMIGAILVGSGYGLLAGILIIIAIGLIWTAITSLINFLRS